MNTRPAPLTADKALQKLASLCAKRELCCYDARQRLFRWGVPQAEHDSIIDQLVMRGFIDDMRFAQMFVEEKTTINQWGRRKVEQELRRRGIDSADIAQLFDGIQPQQTLETLRALLLRKHRTINAKNDYERTQKLIRYAMTRGYSWDDIRQALPQDTQMPEEFNV